MQLGDSPYAGGMLAFSRILNDREVLVIANTATQSDCIGYAIVGASLSPAGIRLDQRYLNKPAAVGPGIVQSAAPLEIHGGRRLGQ